MLGVGSGSHAQQTARVIERLEPVLSEEAPRPRGRAGRRQLDARRRARGGASPASRSPTSSPGCAASTARCPRRSTAIVDRPALRAAASCTRDEAVENLRAEGVAAERMHFVGNTMIDTLVALEDRFRAARAAQRSGVEPGAYLLVTLHRPALVDGPLLADAMQRLSEVAGELPVVFPVHPRTRKALDAVGGRLPGRRAQRPGRLPRLPLARGGRRAPCSPTPAGSRRRRPTSASPASRCATTPSARSRFAPGRTRSSAWPPTGSPRSRGFSTTAPARATSGRRCGTAVRPNATADVIASW